MKDLRQKSVSGVLWSFVDKAGSQFAGFVITIFLARLLSPREFGLVAMATAFFAISRIFIDSGLRDSLIQKKDATQADYDTVFVFNVIVGLVIYALVFVSAPLIADFYKNADLTLLVRVLAINIIVHSFSIIQSARLTKELRFKAFVKARLPAVLVSGGAGLTMAYYGYGVWSLVAQLVFESLLFNILLWLIAKWRPTRQFDRNLFRFHWRHGSRLLLGEGITAVYRNIFALVIGRSFSASQLGLYNRADSFIVVTYNNTVGLIQNVSYPVLAHVQDDEYRLRTSYRKILQLTLLGILPVYLFMILQAEGIIELLLTAKWLEAAPILVVLSFAAIFSPFNSINLNILKVKRRTDLFLRLQVISKGIFIVVVIVMAQLGFQYLVYTNLLGAVMSLFINNYFANKLVSYSLRDQVRDIAGLIAAFAISGGVVYGIISYVHVTDLLIVRVIGNGFLILLLFYLVIFVVQRRLVLDAWSMAKGLVSRKEVK